MVCYVGVVICIFKERVGSRVFRHKLDPAVHILLYYQIQIDIFQHRIVVNLLLNCHYMVTVVTVQSVA